MPVVETVVKKWGNSFGIVVPKDVMKKEHIRENQRIKMIVWKGGRNVLKETFDTMKFKKSAQKMKDELRAELYD